VPGTGTGVEMRREAFVASGKGVRQLEEYDSGIQELREDMLRGVEGGIEGVVCTRLAIATKGPRGEEELP